MHIIRDDVNVPLQVSFLKLASIAPKEDALFPSQVAALAATEQTSSKDHGALGFASLSVRYFEPNLKLKL